MNQQQRFPTNMRDNLTNIANVSHMDHCLLSLVQLELHSANVTYRSTLRRRGADGRDFGCQELGHGRLAMWVREDTAWRVELPPMTDKQKQSVTIKTHQVPGCAFDGTNCITITRLSAMAPVAAAVQNLFQS